jgi:hypothetical protein
MSCKMFLTLTLLLAIGAFSLASAEVMLNEVYYNTPGTDDPNAMFTELWGTPGTNLAGWTLVGISNVGEYRSVPISNGTIPADGYFVIGNTSLVPNVDFVCGGGTGFGVDWQNTSAAGCLGIDLRDGDGTTVDHLCYGPCTTAPPVCTGEGGGNAPSAFPSGSIGQSIARCPDHYNSHHDSLDWAITDHLTPGAANACAPCSSQVVTLSQIRQNNGSGVPLLDSAFVVTRGIVNVDNYLLDSLTNSNFNFQDDDAGVNVYRGTPPPNIVAGDCVVVSGWVSQYRGLTEIVNSGHGSCLYSVQRTAHVAPPTPMVATCASYWEALEGMLVRINHVSIVSGTWPPAGQFASIDITDGSGVVTLRISKWTNVPGSTQPSNPFDVVGVVSQYCTTPPYTTGYEITPRSTSDIFPAAADDPNPVALTTEFELTGAYPNPFNSTTQINFAVGTARNLTLRIFDLLGREVTAEKLTGLAPGEHSYIWKPTGSSGLYLVRLEGAAKVQTAKALYLK